MTALEYLLESILVFTFVKNMLWS